jgi:hypothetical protein
MRINTEQMFKPLYMRHDLMIELGRLEKAIEDSRHAPPGAAIQQLAPLESRQARISEILSRLDS